MSGKRIKKEGRIVRLLPETVDELRKIEGELQAENGHAKSHDDAVQYLIRLHRERKEVS